MPYLRHSGLVGLTFANSTLPSSNMTMEDTLMIFMAFPSFKPPFLVEFSSHVTDDTASGTVTELREVSGHGHGWPGETSVPSPRRSTLT